MPFLNRSPFYSTLIFFVSLGGQTSPAIAQTAVPPGVSAVGVASGLSAPVFVSAPAGDTGRLFIVEQGSAGTARIKILDLHTGLVNSTPFLTISGLMTAGEQGLLGLAFAPDYASSGKFYVDAVTPGGSYGNGVVNIREYNVSSSNPNAADPASAHTLLTVDKPQTNHNGGWIAFSPRANDTGNLYISLGDGGNGNDQGTGHIEPGGNGENTAVLLGKILRINVTGAGLPSGSGNYTIPPGNPFAAGGGAKEVWLYGLRNPFRNSFDRQTGNLFLGDVGQDTREEVDLQRASNSGGGENYGWRLREGTIATPGGSPLVGGSKPAGALDPIFDYPHSIGQAVIGGYVYRGSVLPALQGKYLFADNLGPENSSTNPNNHGRVFALDIDGSGNASNLTDLTAQLFPGGSGPSLLNPYSLGEDARGEIYIADGSGGTIYRVGHALFFNGEASLSSGFYYLGFPNGSPFGYYTYQSFPYLYHIDLGFEYYIDANDTQHGAYLYDFESSTFFYTSPTLFPYLYDFKLNTFLYYYPDTSKPGRYTQNPRYFFDFAAGKVITK